MADEAIVGKLMEILAGTFQKYCIVSDDAKRACISTILSNGRVLDLARSKYDIGANIDQMAALSVFSTGSAIVQKKRKMSINVSVSAADRVAIMNHNPDLQLDFDANQRVNHSVAYVQRVIETMRCMALLRHDKGHITDVGGNPHYHAKAGHDNVHSCVLVDNTRDQARQTLRTLKAEFSGKRDQLKFCTGGVQNCQVDSVEAMSIFAIQDIDPRDLARGLYKKGVEFMTGVFHYDPVMYEQERGYFPYVKMHFERRRDPVTNRQSVVFHFENDPSMDYEHDLEQLLKYSRSWSWRVPGTSYVYRYDLTSAVDGVARFTMVRQNREYLGTAVNEVAYRFVDHTSIYRINSWTLDLDADTNSQFTGFKPVTIDVPDDLFMFLYKFGMANDTENPDKLFTTDQLRAQARTFNATRTLNGYAFTGRLTMSPLELETLLVAMYVLVMHDLTVEGHVAAAQVGTLLDKQRRRTDKRFLSTTGKIVGYSFALPVIFLGGKVSDFAMYVAARMRDLAQVGDMHVSWERVPSFAELPTMQRYSGPGQPETTELTGHSFAPVDKVETFVQPQYMQELFADVLTPEQKLKLKKKLQQPYVEDAEMSSASDEDSEVSSALSPRPAVDSSCGDDLEWYQQDLTQYLQVKREVLWRLDAEHSLATTDEINSHSTAAIAEHARYNFDTAIAQIGSAQTKCSETFLGMPLGNKIDMDNAGQDLGIRYLRVRDGRVDLADGDAYAFGIDPVTGRHWYIESSGDGAYIANRFTTWLFVSNDTVLLNGLKIGKRLLQLAGKQRKLMTEYCLVDAVYGAGKTFEILQRFEFGDLVVTQTRASRDDIHRELSTSSRFSGLSLDKWIRSADSANIHGVPHANVVYIDEGLMMFPGQIYAITKAACARKAYVFGDTAQIPPIDRSMSMGFLTYQTMCRWNSIEFRNVTYRSPADVVLMLAKFFKIERRALLKTANPVKRSLGLVLVKDPEDKFAYNAQHGWTFVTILRVDKARLLQNPKMHDGKKVGEAALKENESRLFNVGEAQGSTFSRVRVCRKFCYGDQLFEKPEQTVVAFSRHMITAEYVTTVHNDPYAKLVRQALEYTDSQLEAVQVETPGWLRDRIQVMTRK